MIILSSNQTSKILYAVSFETVTYHDLECFVSEHTSYILRRISPTDFLSLKNTQLGSYINLVTNDMELRKQITNHLDTNNFDRFSMIHDRSYSSSANIALGCMVYPMAAIYPNATLHQDVIVHAMTLIAHNCQIGRGTFVSGGITIAGSTTIGDFTYIGVDATIYDRVIVAADTKIGAATVVRKNILESGTFSTQVKNKLTKIK